MDIRDTPPVIPLHFFEVAVDVTKKLQPLPNYAEMLDEESFHEMRMGCNDDGISFLLKVEKGFEKAFFPAVEKGDGLELFIDTRGIRDTLIIHKYCHHFIFLPKEVDGILGVEVTRFKTNDTRELAPKELLKVKTGLAKGHYTLEIFIPRVALYGFDPSEYPTLRMAYIVHRGSLEPNHFPKTNKEVNLKDHPSLWAEINL